jgi:FkbM family methyltransferase
MMLDVFPEAVVHLVEPQPACQPALERLARTSSSLTVHPVALTEPGRQHLAFTGGVGYGGTGVHVAQADEHDVELECRATTLDELFGGRVSRADRPLLKLDLEGHELSALRGARTLLEAIEVLFVEVRFTASTIQGDSCIFRRVHVSRDHEFESTTWPPRIGGLALRMHDGSDNAERKPAVRGQIGSVNPFAYRRADPPSRHCAPWFRWIHAHCQDLDLHVIYAPAPTARRRAWDRRVRGTCR